MRLLSIAAAGLTPDLPAMLITRQGGRSGDALAVARCRRRVHRKAFSQNVNRQPSLSGLVGGQVESAEARGAERALLRTRGRDQARAVLGTSRDMLLSAAGSEA